jgi:2-methylisocitrate lyase-like PEP mutase family enzyme
MIDKRGLHMHDPSAAEKRLTLKSRLHSGRIVVAPGIYDLVSVRIADRMGFDSLYMSGFGTVASYLGVPDAGLATYTDMVDRVAAFCGAARTPIVCDGDTGYGGLLNVAHTIRGYERAGAAGIQLEDQEFPKKCGHTPGRRVIPAEEMVRKLKVAVETRTDPNFQIVARTDARSSLGLDEALRRGELYARAGADVIFIESPESEQELEIIGRSFDQPLFVNIVEGGKTPQLPPDELQRLGFSLAIYPVAALLAAAQAMTNVYAEILARRGTGAQAGNLYAFADICKVMGFEAVWEFDRQHAE